MLPERKALLTSVFEALGPARLARGLTANGHTWSDCFLAVAVSGEVGSLAHELKRRGRTDVEHFVSALVAVPVQAVGALVRQWDRDEAEVRALAAEWLELNRAPAPVAQALQAFVIENVQRIEGGRAAGI